MKKPLTYSLAALGFVLTLSFAGVSIAQTGPAGVGSTSDNRIWLDAHALGFTDGAAIASWADLSGNGANFVQGASSRQPVYNTTGISGIPSVTFDGVNDVLASGSIPDLETPNITYFVVYDRTTTTSDMIINADYASSFKKWRTYMNNGQNTIVSAHFSPTINWVRYNDPAGASFFSTHITPSNIRTYNQGDLEQSKSASYSTPTGHNNVFLGNRNATATSSYTYTGEISELIVYNDALNDLERILVENYLGAKYGMTIPTDHYAYDGTHKFGLIALADDGTNSQAVARGAGILELSDATDLGSGEYFVVAHTDFSPTEYNLVNLPAELPAHQRLERTWRVGETGDVGTTTLTFHLADGDFAVPDSYRLLVDDDGDFSDATTVSGTYDAGTSTVTFTTNLSDGQYFTLSGILEILEIHSVTTGNWSEITTWDCECIPAANDHVYIDPGHAVTVDIDGYTDYLKIEFTGELIMDTDVTLDINGDWEITGTADFTDGTVSLTGDVAQNVRILSTAALVVGLNDVIVENTSDGNVSFINKTFSLGGTLSPNRGNIVIDPGTTFIVESNSASEGGRIGPIIAPTTITGNFDVQRMIPAGNADWRDLCSPVIGSTFDDWDPDLSMSGPGFPDGCAYGPEDCFRSVTYTDHSIQYDVLNSTDNIQNGRGYEIFIGDDLSTFSGATITSKGSLNTFSDITKSYTTGWTIMGNPYASPIAFSTLTRSGSIGNYFYVFDPATGAYEWYDGASGATSIAEITEDGLMSVGQSVWIYASSAGTVTFNQSNKVSNNATFIRTSTTDNSLHLTLSENASTYKCVMLIEEKDGAADGLDEVLDIRHLSTSQTVAPSLAVQSDTELLRKNYVAKDGREKSFTLHTEILNEGYYTISATNWANFRHYEKILLFDQLTGETANLKESNYVFYSVADNPEAKPVKRFTLILSNSADANENGGLVSNETAIETEFISLKVMGNIIDVQSEESLEELTTITLTNVLGQKEVFTTTASILAGSNLITLPSSLKGFHIVTLRTGDKVVTQKIVL